jgi:hypothetical protein
MNAVRFVGLDVDAETIAIAVAEADGHALAWPHPVLRAQAGRRYLDGLVMMLQRSLIWRHPFAVAATQTCSNT